jgi:Transcriptional regulators
MARLTSLREDIINAGLNPTSFVTLVQQVDANDTLASIMSIPVGEKLIFFHRIRYGSGTPIAVQDVHIREKYCSASLIKNLGNDSIYDTLEQDLGLVIDYADLMLTAKMPTKKQCQELNISGDAPLLLMKRTAYLNNSDTLEYAETYYVTSRYEWTLKSYRDSSVKTENR